MRELYKDVQIGENSYRIHKMTARSGSWMAMQVMSYMLPSAVQLMATSMGSNAIPVASQSRTMTEAEFHNIQDGCLAVCTRLREEPTGAQLYFPLLHDSGRWNFPELETDVVTIMELTIHALMFNLRPFFEDGAMAKLMVAAGMPAKTAPKSQPATSTDSSSDPLLQATGVTMKRGTARIS